MEKKKILEDALVLRRLKRCHKRQLSRLRKLLHKRLKQKSMETQNSNYRYLSQRKQVKYRNEIYDCNFAFHFGKDGSYVEIEIPVPRAAKIKEKITFWTNQGFLAFEKRLNLLFDQCVGPQSDDWKFEQQFFLKDLLSLDNDGQPPTNNCSEPVTNTEQSASLGAFLKTETDRKRADIIFELFQNNLLTVFDLDVLGPNNPSTVENIRGPKPAPVPKRESKFITYDGVEKFPGDVFYDLKEISPTLTSFWPKLAMHGDIQMVKTNCFYGSYFFCFRFADKLNASEFIEKSNVIAKKGLGQPWRIGHAMIHAGFSQEEAKKAVEKYISMHYQK